MSFIKGICSFLLLTSVLWCIDLEENCAQKYEAKGILKMIPDEEKKTLFFQKKIHEILKNIERTRSNSNFIYPIELSELFQDSYFIFSNKSLLENLNSISVNFGYTLPSFIFVKILDFGLGQFSNSYALHKQFGSNINYMETCFLTYESYLMDYISFYKIDICKKEFNYLFLSSLKINVSLLAADFLMYACVLKREIATSAHLSLLYKMLIVDHRAAMMPENKASVKISFVNKKLKAIGHIIRYINTFSVPFPEETSFLKNIFDPIIKTKESQYALGCYFSYLNDKEKFIDSYNLFLRFLNIRKNFKRKDIQKEFIFYMDRIRIKANSKSKLLFLYEYPLDFI